LLVVGKTHPFASRTEISVTDIAEETFVTMGDGSTLAAQIRAFFGELHFELKISHRCAQVATLKSFVAMGAGISILPNVARLPHDRETLTYLKLTGASPTRELAVIRHLQRYQSRGAEQFIALLREHARTQSNESATPSTAAR
jgi:LysR family hydrogen peroxide-inducible transcriptional activator